MKNYSYTHVASFFVLIYESGAENVLYQKIREKYHVFKIRLSH